MVIEACEAAWELYAGVFRVLLPGNTKAIVQTADPLEPSFTEAFLVYAQARGFHIDPSRVRALYSQPTRLIGPPLRARAEVSAVRGGGAISPCREQSPQAADALEVLDGRLQRAPDGRGAAQLDEPRFHPTSAATALAT